MSENTETLPFRSLEFPGAPWNRWAWSLAINAGIVIALVAIPVTVERAVQPPARIATISLDSRFSPSLVKPPKRSPVIRPVVIPPKPAAFKASPAPAPEAKPITLPPAPVEIPKPVKIVVLEPPKIDFPPSPAPSVSHNAPLKSVHIGGFGDPNGAAASPVSTGKGLVVPKVGLFDSPAGPASGKGQSGAGKLVASAGFGDASEGSVAAAGGRGSVVRGAGFGDYDQTPAQPSTVRAARAAASDETPVEITFKPKPAYTSEAREKKIEGEVLLEVQFSSGGQIRVLHLLRGLGYGLDESARAAASRIRFHPATRGGSPVDVTGTVHISFELS